MHINQLSPIYLDHAATTPVRPEVIQAMSHVMRDDYGNPSSRHGLGLKAEQHLQSARYSISQKIGVKPEQVVFTSGGTEANALALYSAIRSRRKRNHLLLSAIEHPSILHTARMLEDQGIQVEILPVTREGVVDPEELMARLRPETFLVGVMHINNETGMIQPVTEITRHVKQHYPHCHVLVDAIQSFPILPLDMGQIGADFLTLSAHKIHGPKGVGCLVVSPSCRVVPFWGGGEQESNRRSGTENVPGIIGFGRAVELMTANLAQLAQLNTWLVEQVTTALPQVYAIGAAPQRAPHIVSLAIPGIPSEVLVNALEERGIYVSSGSACHSRKSLRSHVMESLGIPASHGVMRVSFSYTTTSDEVQRAAKAIIETVKILFDMLL